MWPNGDLIAVRSQPRRVIHTLVAVRNCVLQKVYEELYLLVSGADLQYFSTDLRGGDQGILY